MDLTLTTPALLFPTVSLLMVAYTNRFLTVASRIRSLHTSYQSSPDRNILGQIKSLRLRVRLIKNMQALGITCLLLCVLCMFVLFTGYQLAGKIIFGMSLLMLMLSLIFSFMEIHLSVEALNLSLNNFRENEESSGEVNYP